MRKNQKPNQVNDPWYIPGGPRLEREGCARSGHVTGQRSLRGRGSRKGLQRAPTNTMLFSDYHLAKLNPKCYMNYSIIFTEISFSPETSKLNPKCHMNYS